MFLFCEGYTCMQEAFFFLVFMEMLFSWPVLLRCSFQWVGPQSLYIFNILSWINIMFMFSSLQGRKRCKIKHFTFALLLKCKEYSEFTKDSFINYFVDTSATWAVHPIYSSTIIFVIKIMPNSVMEVCLGGWGWMWRTPSTLLHPIPTPLLPFPPLPPFHLFIINIWL